MSVILKALRAQQEEGAAGATPSGDGTSSFQMDTSSSPGTAGGGGGSNKHTIILAIVLAASILLAIVLHVIRKSREEPPPTPLNPQGSAAAPVIPQVPSPRVEGGLPRTEQEGAVNMPPASNVHAGMAPAANEANNDQQIAQSQYKLGQYDDSIKSFQRALEKSPNNSSIHNDMGLALLKKELFTSAEGHFAKALELDDKCSECYNNLGYLKTLLNQPVEAEKYLQKAITLKPDYSDPYFNLGVMYEKNGDVGRAVDAYREFLKRIPRTETELAAKIRERVRDLSGE